MNNVVLGRLDLQRSCECNPSQSAYFASTTAFGSSKCNQRSSSNFSYSTLPSKSSTFRRTSSSTSKADLPSHSLEGNPATEIAQYPSKGLLPSSSHQPQQSTDHKLHEFQSETGPLRKKGLKSSRESQLEYQVRGMSIGTFLEIVGAHMYQWFL